MTSRRDFLRQSSLIALAPTVPSFLAHTARATTPKKPQRVLVVLQLDGGNDGINTVVPYADEGYAKHRKELRISEDRLLKIDDHIGLHRSLSGMSKLLEDGKLAIVQGAGYPNPSRSHAVSMAIWQTCRFDPEEHKSWGWIGRAMDHANDREKHKLTNSPSSAAMLVGDQQPPIALRGRRSVASAISQVEDYVLPETFPAISASDGSVAKETPDNLSAFVRRSLVDAYELSDKIEKTAVIEDSSSTKRRDSARYPATSLGQKLQLVSRLIKADWGAQVYYVVQSGYDTHAAQLFPHSRLLREMSDAVKAFVDDMSASRLEEQTLLMTFSEFGRRVKENASLGTDHGTAGPMFLAGAAVESGLIGAAPLLMELEKGDLKRSIDFRRVYASVLEDWLGVDSTTALGGSFDPVKLIARV